MSRIGYKPVEPRTLFRQSRAQVRNWWNRPRTAYVDESATLPTANLHLSAHCAKHELLHRVPR